MRDLNAHGGPDSAGWGTLAATCSVKRDRSPTPGVAGNRATASFRELPPDDAGHADAPIPAQVPRTCLYGGQQAAPRQAASSVQAELGAMPGAVAKRSKSMLAPSVSTARRRAGAHGRSGLMAVCGRCRMWRQVEFIDLADQIDAETVVPLFFGQLEPTG